VYISFAPGLSSMTISESKCFLSIMKKRLSAWGVSNSNR
jgi:hypothetical protein